MTRHDMRYGYHPDLPDHRDRIFRDHLAVTPPPSADLRPHCPPIYQQSTLGACTGNGWARAVDIVRHVAGEPFMSPSRLFIYWNEREREGTTESDAGAQIRDGAKVMTTVGAPPETDWPYDIARFRVKPPKAAFADAVPHKALSYERIADTSIVMRQKAVMVAIANKCPVVLGCTVFSSFESAETIRTGMVPMPRPGERVEGGHCMVVTFYGMQDTFNGAPGIDNSWGADVGVGGRFSLPWPYLCDPQYTSDLWVLKKVSG